MAEPEGGFLGALRSVGSFVGDVGRAISPDQARADEIRKKYQDQGLGDYDQLAAQGKFDEAMQALGRAKDAMIANGDGNEIGRLSARAQRAMQAQLQAIDPKDPGAPGRMTQLGVSSGAIEPDKGARVLADINNSDAQTKLYGAQERRVTDLLPGEKARIEAQTGSSNALAGKYGAEADQTRQLTGPKVATEQADAKGKTAAAWFDEARAKKIGKMLPYEQQASGALSNERRSSADLNDRTDSRHAAKKGANLDALAAKVMAKDDAAQPTPTPNGPTAAGWFDRAMAAVTGSSPASAVAPAATPAPAEAPKQTPAEIFKEIVIDPEIQRRKQAAEERPAARPAPIDQEALMRRGASESNPQPAQQGDFQQLPAVRQFKSQVAQHAASQPVPLSAIAKQFMSMGLSQEQAVNEARRAMQEINAGVSPQ